MQEKTRLRLDDFWSRRLGCAPRPLSAHGVTVMAHAAALDGYAGVYLLRRGGVVVLSAPSEFTNLLREAVRERRAEEVADARFLTVALDAAAGLVIGPTYLGYADASSLSGADSPEARRLLPEDAPALDGLRGAVSSADWEHAGIDTARLDPSSPEPIAGRFARERLVAAASYATQHDEVAHVGVVTHAEHRSAGYAREAAHVVCRHALERGLILQWQALESNLPSLRIAESLGFERYATSLAVRIELPDPT